MNNLCTRAEIEMFLTKLVLLVGQQSPNVGDRASESRARRPSDGAVDAER
jgi:hypothetical protein